MRKRSLIGCLCFALLCSISIAQEKSEKELQDEVIKAYQKQAYDSAHAQWMKSYYRELETNRQQELWRSTMGDYWVYYANAAEQDNESQYWLGVQCVPSGKVKIKYVVGSLSAEVEMFHDGGLLVNSVTDDSPAEKAGLKPGDILIKFGKTSLKEIKDLVTAIHEVEGKQQELLIIRDGSVMDINVQPVERPSSPNEKAIGDLTWHNPKLAAGEYKPYYDLVDPQFQGQFTWLAGHRMLPDDVELMLVCRGQDDPYMIVKRGDDQWTIRKGEIDELPDDVQEYAGHIYKSAKKSTQNVQPSWRYGLYQNVNPDTETDEGQASLKEVVKALTQQVDKLQRTVEKLQKDN